MLSFLYTENYKNLKFDGKVDLKNLNIFIGPNGSGKSNLISYLKFLNKCVCGYSDNSGQVNSFELAVSQLNRILDIDLSLPSIVRIAYGFSGFLSPEEELIILDVNLYITQQFGKISIANAKEFVYLGDDLEERLNNPRYIYKFHEKEIGKGNLWNDLADNNQYLSIDNVPINNIGFNSSIFNSYRGRDSAYMVLEFCLLQDILYWKFYNSNDMNLNTIRTSEPKIGPDDIFLSTTGDNLALVVDNLSQNLDFEDALNLAMKSIFPKTRRIRAVRVGRLSLTIEWHIEGSNEPLYLNEMSDGTVRMLCWAVILHSPKLPSLLVIDEPELGLHPAWLSVLAQWIKQTSEKTQIILTTHSPDLLDKFTDRLENVYCF
jgi:energy-coupling factor transporter ATP-binding protein EcfA2